MVERVAVIGAGPSGLGVLQAFASAKAKGAAIPEIVCFDKQDDWGGLWHYSWRTGSDRNGEPAHGSMYRALWSNGPKECLEFADYSFEAHFGRAIPSFPPRPVLYDYIVGRSAKAGVKDWIRFETAVRMVKPAGEKFEVTVESLPDHTVTTEVFDKVIVASGHFSTPNVPDFAGIDSFPGRVMHAHDFRDARAHAGQHILVVGASYSAEDIALQCWKFGAASVTCTYRTAAMGFHWPEGVDERPLVERFEGRTAFFKDGTSKDFDTVMLCTGYLHHFPFMEDSLRLRTANLLYAPGLWKGVVWHANPGVFYIGMQDQWYTFTMFDAEGWFARDVILGRIALPDAGARAAHMAEWAAKDAAAEDAYAKIDFQADYVAELMKDTDYPAFDLDSTRASFKTWKKDKETSILGYRNSAFPSPVTGTMSPAAYGPWAEAMDDSLEAFLAGQPSPEPAE
ncbi:MAG: NAD(P)/FAD-dependent oxidoreductase [Pseudomonadota bacterium]